MKVYAPEAVDAAERYLINEKGISSLRLMKAAAYGMYVRVKDTVEKECGICVLCGKGNNSGDGYELARLLYADGYEVICVRVFSGAPSTDIAHICYDGFVQAGGKIIDGNEEALRSIASSDVIIDAVFGIGFKGIIEKESFLYRIFALVNGLVAKKIAIDVPSGVNSSDGSVENIAFCAHETFAVSVIKTGMISYPAKKYCGKVSVIDIGIHENIIERFGNACTVPDDLYIKSVLPERKEDSHKGDFGKLLCICGSENMTGAAVMSVSAALRAGAGLVTLASGKSVTDVVKLVCYEAIYKTTDFEDDGEVYALLQSVNDYDSVLIGCGFGTGEKKRYLIEEIIKNYCGRLIIDADGINLISCNIDVLREAKGTVILTPHPGEFSRISGISVPEINSNRIKCAHSFAHTYRCITVLKGAGTVVSDGERFSVNMTGNPGLAKGGSGDVLAGLIAGLAANKEISPFDAALSGVYLHGKAADVLKDKYSEYGLLPSDIVKEIAALLP